MATAVTAWASSQSRSSRSSAVVVPKVRTSCPCPPPAPGARTHAVTVFLCTSSPQLRSTMRSIAALLWPCRRPEEGPHHDFARRARWQQFRVPAPPASVSAPDSRTTDTRRRPSGSAPFSSPRADFVHARFCVWSKPQASISWHGRDSATERDSAWSTELRPSPRAGVDETRAKHQTSELDGSGASAGAVLLEVATGLELAGEGMADHPLGELPRFDHGVEVDARVDPELLTEKDEVLGGDVAGGALVGGEGAAAHAGHRAVEAVDAHLERGDHVGDGERARVVKLKLHRRLRPALAHQAYHALYLEGIGPAHGVGEPDAAQP